MPLEELIGFLNKVKCWMPQSNSYIRNEIDVVIARLKHLKGEL